MFTNGHNNPITCLFYDFLSFFAITDWVGTASILKRSTASGWKLFLFFPMRLSYPKGVTLPSIDDNLELFIFIYQYAFIWWLSAESRCHCLCRNEWQQRWTGRTSSFFFNGCCRLRKKKVPGDQQAGNDNQKHPSELRITYNPHFFLFKLTLKKTVNWRSCCRDANRSPSLISCVVCSTVKNV